MLRLLLYNYVLHAKCSEVVCSKLYISTTQEKKDQNNSKIFQQILYTSRSLLVCSGRVLLFELFFFFFHFEFANTYVMSA